jgi:hypothetical protein
LLNDKFWEIYGKALLTDGSALVYNSPHIFVHKFTYMMTSASEERATVSRASTPAGTGVGTALSPLRHSASAYDDDLCLIADMHKVDRLAAQMKLLHALHPP